jgi:putative SOS response-associated peptidase YedK
MVIERSLEELSEIYDAAAHVDPGQRTGPRYNVAPTQPIRAVRLDREGRRELVSVRWGLIPSWSKEGPSGKPLFNARGETVASRPAFRKAFAARRCLIPASGFYEWKKTAAGANQPFYFSRSDGLPLAFAGLWEWWKSPDEPDAPALESAAIITTSANGDMAPIHDRMPAVLYDAEEQAAWLDPRTTVAVAQTAVKPLPEGLLNVRPVHPRVNNARVDDPRCIEPLNSQ